MKKLLLTAVLSAVVLAPSAMAESMGAFGPKLSTLGIGAEYEYPINENLGVSAGIYGFKYDRNETRSNVRYDADLRLRHIPVLAHYYPWEQGFRLTGGIVFNATKLTANAIPSAAGRIELDGTEYDLETAKAKADFRKVAPYLGVGWASGDRNKAGLSFTADAGVMFTGKPRVSLTPVCATTCAADIVNAAKKEEAQLTDDINANVYPVISLGLMYRF